MNNMITIITVHYDDIKNFLKTYNSILEQDTQDFEYIVVDGGSDEHILTELKELKRVDQLLTEKDDGPYDAMNKGIKLSSNEWLLFLNSGDTLYSNDILTKVKVLLKDEITLLYGLAVVNGRENNIAGKEVSLKDFRNRMPICHQSVFFRKETIEKYNGYDTNYKICADQNLMIKIFQNEDISTFKFMNEIICNYELGGISQQRVFLNFYEKFRIANNMTNNKKVISVFFIFTLRVIKYLIRKIFTNEYRKKI